VIISQGLLAYETFGFLTTMKVQGGLLIFQTSLKHVVYTIKRSCSHRNSHKSSNPNFIMQLHTLTHWCLMLLSNLCNQITCIWPWPTIIWLLKNGIIHESNLIINSNRPLNLSSGNRMKFWETTLFSLQINYIRKGPLQGYSWGVSERFLLYHELAQAWKSNIFFT